MAYMVFDGYSMMHLATFMSEEEAYTYIFDNEGPDDMYFVSTVVVH